MIILTRGWICSENITFSFGINLLSNAIYRGELSYSAALQNAIGRNVIYLEVEGD